MSTPAGWYPDPDEARTGGGGTLRWWNGGTWTDDRRGASPSLVKPPPPPEGPSAGWQTPPAPASPGPWTPAPPFAAPSGEPLASVWARLGARILDGLLLGVLTALAAAPFWQEILRITLDYSERALEDPSVGQDPFALYSDPEFASNALAASVVGLVLGALYEVLFVRLRGATPGKLALGLRVRQLQPLPDPTAVGWRCALLRWVVLSVPAQVTPLWSLLDSLWCTWDPRRQCLHDKPAGSVVVTTRGTR